MHKPKELNVTEPCPSCGGSFRKAPQPTADMRAHAASRDDSTWRPIPPHYDTAPQDVVDDLGELWTCTECGMPHRVKPAADAAHA